MKHRLLFISFFTHVAQYSSSFVSKRDGWLQSPKGTQYARSPVSCFGRDRTSRHSISLHYSSTWMNENDSTETQKTTKAKGKGPLGRKSYISSIRSRNLVDAIPLERNNGNEISIRFDCASTNGSNLIVVSGETGSGKKRQGRFFCF